MSRIDCIPARAAQPSLGKLTARFLGVPLVLIILAATSNTSLAQGTLNLLGTGTPAVVDSGDARPVVLAVTVVSDVAGQVLGCSFYKSPANTGVHVVSLWDSTGKILASQAATGETASGKQTVMFSTPVAIAAEQTRLRLLCAKRSLVVYRICLHDPVRRCAFAHSGQRELVPLWHIGSAITNSWLPAQLLG